MIQTEILITKASGELVPYDATKLKNSLRNAGASHDATYEIEEEIRNILKPGMSTQKIYKKAFNLLKSKSRPCAARYKLKKAIMELGPSGYPFEKFVGELLKEQGYQVKVGVIQHGHCITHEVDVEAENETHYVGVECKFGNSTEKKVAVKVPLYIRSRFEDLKTRWLQDSRLFNKRLSYWIVTNTSFTEDAINYGQCSGLAMIGWDYPKGNSLKSMIEKSGLYPITSLVSITQKEKKVLLGKGIVLCKHLKKDINLLEELRISTSKKDKTLDELASLCSV